MISKDPSSCLSIAGGTILRHKGLERGSFFTGTTRAHVVKAYSLDSRAVLLSNILGM